MEIQSPEREGKRRSSTHLPYFRRKAGRPPPLEWPQWERRSSLPPSQERMTLIVEMLLLRLGCHRPWHEMLGDEGLCTYFRRGFLVAEMGIHVGEHREREFAWRPFAGRAPGSAPLWSALSAGTLLWASVPCLLVADSLAVLRRGHCPTWLLQLICGHLSSTLYPQGVTFLPVSPSKSQDGIPSAWIL